MYRLHLSLGSHCCTSSAASCSAAKQARMESRLTRKGPASKDCMKLLVAGTPRSLRLCALPDHQKTRSQPTVAHRTIQPNPPPQSTVSDKGLGLLELANNLFPQKLLVTGAKEGARLAWQTMVKELAPQTKSGAYARPAYTFNGCIGSPEFPVDSGRYHLYLGNACPWCHRVLLTLVLRGLTRPGPDGQPLVSVTQLADDPTAARRGGWVFSAANPDPVWDAKDLWEVYDMAKPGFSGRCTAPLLVDRKSLRIVSNESSDIVRMLNGLHLPGCTEVDLYPADLRKEIDALNERIYQDVNNGVYASGFATSQTAYNAAQSALYKTLDELEVKLGDAPFLLGSKLTEADVRLLPTLVRFDAVYAVLFKCSRRRLSDYPNLSAWMKRMWSLHVEGSTMQVWDTVDVDAARSSYFTNLFPLNPSGIIPAGPTAADLGLVKPGDDQLTALDEVAYARPS